MCAFMITWSSVTCMTHWDRIHCSLFFVLGKFGARHHWVYLYCSCIFWRFAMICNISLYWVNKDPAIIASCAVYWWCLGGSSIACNCLEGWFRNPYCPKKFVNSIFFWGFNNYPMGDYACQWVCTFIIWYSPLLNKSLIIHNSFSLC